MIIQLKFNSKSINLTLSVQILFWWTSLFLFINVYFCIEQVVPNITQHLTFAKILAVSTNFTLGLFLLNSRNAQSPVSGAQSNAHVDFYYLLKAHPTHNQINFLTLPQRDSSSANSCLTSTLHPTRDSHSQKSGCHRAKMVVDESVGQSEEVVHEGGHGKNQWEFIILQTAI